MRIVAGFGRLLGTFWAISLAPARPDAAGHPARPSPGEGLIQLEASAGIAEVAKRLRAEPPHYEFIYDAAERLSDEQRALEEGEERSHQARITRRLRKLYFSVSDVELRKKLMAKTREMEGLDLRFGDKNWMTLQLGSKRHALHMGIGGCGHLFWSRSLSALAFICSG